MGKTPSLWSRMKPLPKKNTANRLLIVTAV
jgi:hypothetical protein